MYQNANNFAIAFCQVGSEHLHNCASVDNIELVSSPASPECSSQEHDGAEQFDLPVDTAAVDRCARIFRAMGDVSRLRLLSRLSHGPACVGELAAAEQESITTISQRLRILRADNIVQRKRNGKHVLYSLADQHMLNLVFNGLAHASEHHTTVSTSNLPKL